jgi:hypothetical protein
MIGDTAYMSANARRTGNLSQYKQFDFILQPSILSLRRKRAQVVLYPALYITDLDLASLAILAPLGLGNPWHFLLLLSLSDFLGGRYSDVVGNVKKAGREGCRRRAAASQDISRPADHKPHATIRGTSVMKMGHTARTGTQAELCEVLIHISSKTATTLTHHSRIPGMARAKGPKGTYSRRPWRIEFLNSTKCGFDHE